MVDTLYDNYYKSREKLAREFAAILNQEARELERAGADVIQFDEPAFNVYMDEVRDWGVSALEAAAAGLKCKTAVHICYGYGIKANNDWKKTLGSEWRQYESTFPLLAKSKIDQVSLECANSHVPLELLALLKGKDVHGRRDRRGERRRRDARASRGDPPRGYEIRPGRRSSTPAPTAAWCRSRATWRWAS